jgi:hypothetical protein
MTSSTTPDTAASKGGTTESSTEGTPAKPERGAARLRETEVYHLTSLVESALSEAEHMVRQVQNKARDRWLDHDNTSEPLNADEISRLLSEAYQCGHHGGHLHRQGGHGPARQRWRNPVLILQP